MTPFFVFFSSLFFSLFIKTLLLTAFALFVGATTAAFRFRDVRVERLCWGFVLATGLFGATLPLISPISSDSVALNRPPLQASQDVETKEFSAVFDSPPNRVSPNGLAPNPPIESAPTLAETALERKKTFRLDAKTGLFAAFLFWASGVGVLTAFGLAARRRVCWELRTARRPSDDDSRRWLEICAAANVPAERVPLLLTRDVGPALIWTAPGRSAVAVPEEFWRVASDAVREGVARHELAHWRRGDVWRTLFAQTISTLHWFNPAARFAARRYVGALESSCDLAAFGGDRDGARRFLESTLTLGETAPGFATRRKTSQKTLQNSFGRGDLVRRFERLKNFSANDKETKMKKTALLTSVLAAFAFASTFAAAPDSDDLTRGEKTSSENVANGSERPVEQSAAPIPATYVSEAPDLENSNAAESSRLVQAANDDAWWAGCAVDENGDPLAGATATFFAETKRRADSFPKNRRVLAVSKSDSNGVWTFDRPEKTDATFNAYSIVWSQEGRVPYEHPCLAFTMDSEKVDEKIRDLTPVRLIPGVPLFGRVVDENGRPIAGVPILLRRFENSSRSSNFWLESDADGRFHTVVSPGGSVEAAFVSDEFAPKKENWGERVGDVGDVELTRGVRTTLKLLDSNGRSVSKEALANRRWDVRLEPSGVHDTACFRFADVDENGVATFEPVAEGAVRFSVYERLNVEFVGAKLLSLPEVGVFPSQIFREITSEEKDFAFQASAPTTLTIRSVEPFDLSELKKNLFALDCRRNVAGLKRGDYFLFKGDAAQVVDPQTIRFENVPADATQLMLSLDSTLERAFQYRLAGERKFKRPVRDGGWCLLNVDGLNDTTLEREAAPKLRETSSLFEFLENAFRYYF